MQKDNEPMLQVIQTKAGISRYLNQKLVAVVEEEILQPETCALSLLPMSLCHDTSLSRMKLGQREGAPGKTCMT